MQNSNKNRCISNLFISFEFFLEYILFDFIKIIKNFSLNLILNFSYFGINDFHFIRLFFFFTYFFKYFCLHLLPNKFFKFFHVYWFSSIFFKRPVLKSLKLIFFVLSKLYITIRYFIKIMSFIFFSFIIHIILIIYFCYIIKISLICVIFICRKSNIIKYRESVINNWIHYSHKR